MLVIDASEARSNSKLSQAVIDAAQVIDGFELLTGADILVSPLSEPKLPNKLTEAVPHRMMLAEHTKVGMLAQRKDGLDLISSTKDLCNIQKKMLDWCGKIGPWLLSVGRFEQRKDGRFFVNGSEVVTNHTYKSIKAALDWWQLRGGHVTELHSAWHVTAWINHWHESMLHKLGSEPERMVLERPPAQAMKGPESDWWIPLAVIPQIGPIKAKVLADWLPEDKRTLAHALCYLCDERNIGFNRPPGFGVKSFEATKETLGLEENQVVRIITVNGQQGYPVVLTWPADSHPATVEGQWWRDESGIIHAVYNSQNELETCLGVMEATK